MLSKIQPVLEMNNESLPEATRIQYAKAGARMVKCQLLPEEIGAKSRGAYNFYRAALIHVTIVRIRALYDLFTDPANTWSAKRSHDMLTLLERGLVVLRNYPPHERGSPSRWAAPSRWKRPAGGVVRHSKRRRLGRLPPRWQLAFIDACQAGAKYHEALLVLSLTGLRPAELKKGVSVSFTGQARLTITIRGAKVTATTGQPERRLWLKIDNPIAWTLFDAVEAHGLDRDLVVSIGDTRKFSDYVRGMSRRLFPKAGYVVSPYSFRHAFAAGQKAQHVPPSMLAQMMGHLAQDSQRAYGVARQGQLSFAHVVQVVTTRAIRSSGDARPLPTRGPVLRLAV